MQNTGTWNSDFAVMLVLLMLAPVFITFLVNLIGLFYQSDTDTTVSLSKQPDFDDIKRAALEKASNGDRYARDWCMKHVYGFDSKPTKTTKQKAQSANPVNPVKPVKQVVTFLTSKGVMQDTIQALIKVGFKKNEAQRLVTHLGATKKYKEVGEMFLEIIQKHKK